MGAAAPASIALLSARERRSLRVSVVARVACIVGAVIVVLPTAGRMAELVGLLAAMAVMAAAQLALLAELRRPSPRLTLVGWAGAVTDAAVVVGLPVLWHIVYTTPNEPLVHLTRHNYTAACLVLMALSIGALRPALPAFVGATVVASHVVLAALAITDPRLERYDGGFETALGIGTGETDLLVVTPFLLAIGTTLLTLATRAARATVVEVVALEEAERELRERQLEAVLDARMAALGELVAGLEHEVNSPLGALQSAGDTGARAVTRLREALVDAQQADVKRALAALDTSLELSRQGSARVAEVMAAIRGFVQLDAAELQRVDLAELLDDVLAVTRSALRDDTELATDLPKGLVVLGDPRRLAQAFTTVVRNASEAFDGPGRLEVRLMRDDDAERPEAVVRVTDGGRGMAPAQVETLFDVAFAAGTRIRARFGLPLCRSILRRHGGDVTIASTPGEGTTVTLRLPLA